jgi:hypothetical protein
VISPALYTKVGADAARDLVFSSGQASSLTGVYTYTRAGTAWDYGSGVSYPANTPPVQAGQGFLIEPARTNLVTNSNDLSAASWTVGGTLIATPNAVLAPDGTMTGCQVSEGTGSGGHNRFCSTAALTNGVNAENGAWLQYVDRQYVAVRGLTITGSFWAWAVFDLLNGSVADSINCSAVSIAKFGSWYLTRTRWLSNSAGTGQLLLAPRDVATAPVGATAGNYVGTSKKFNVWCAQFEQSPFTTSPIPTAGATASRSAPTCVASFSASAWTYIHKVSTAPGVVTGVDQVLWQGDDATTGNRYTLRRDASQNIIAECFTGGVSQRSLTLGTAADAIDTAIGLSMGAGGLHGYLRGGTLQSGAVASPPTLTTERLGHNIAGSHWGRFIGRQLQYTSQIPDASMQAIVDAM